MNDLDARVAALMVLADAFASEKTLSGYVSKRAELDQALRTELQTLTAERDNWKAAASDQYSEVTKLQKPALHEPVTDDEVQCAMATAYAPSYMHHEAIRDMMRRTLESFLQGRAQQAPTSAVATSWCRDFPALAADLINHYQHKLSESAQPILTDQLILDAAEKAGLWPNTVHHWLPAFHRYHAELDATFRASKGEKT